jgi:hypothetical protein
LLFESVGLSAFALPNTPPSPPMNTSQFSIPPSIDPHVAFSAKINLFEPSATFNTMGKCQELSLEVEYVSDSIQTPI